MSDNNKENISLGALNNSKKKIRPVDIVNNKKDIKLADIDKQRLAISNWMPWNRLLSKLSSFFKKVIFDKSKFLTGTLVLDTQYKYFRSQNNNLFYFFND